MVDIMVTKSAILPPFAIEFNAFKLDKPGERN
ncbi:uncharacterized protein METZ01_LOCUS352725, partial [marine metagenome]